MASVNKAIIVGNLGKNPEVRSTQSGKWVASFSVATAEKWKGRDGQTQEKTEWHNIVAWGKLAEIVGQYLVKGSQVYIEGRLQTRSWEDKDGNTRYMTEIVANTMQMLGRKGEGGQQNRQQSSWPQPGPQGQEYQGNQGQPNSGHQPYEDDLPF